MSDYWTNFAKTGDPNGEGLPEWPRNTVETPLTMCFDDNGVKARNIVKGGLDQQIIDKIIADSGIKL
jgi:carboxylesterase type B